MKRFKHIDARTLEAAAAILKENSKKAKILAGGTDLMSEMKDDILPEFPEVVVNIKTISGLDYIHKRRNSLIIGALTRLQDIANNKLVKEKCNLLAEAAQATASPHIRDMGTIGGNICQNNRCWYYWVPNNQFNCLRKGGKECYALTGDGRYHSIFGANRISTTPCAAECPNNTDVPSYLSKIRDNKLAEAARMLLDFNPIPAITGRVCPHFCEGGCNRENYDEAVSIREIERSIGDNIIKNYFEFYKTPVIEVPTSVAIIGSGPAGLTAAYFLRRSGHKVTIFDRMHEPGGLLIFGIPSYRLSKDLVRKQIKALKHMGIRIQIDTEVTKDKVLNNICKNFDAVFIACGAWKERPVGIDGENLMRSGTEFLRSIISGSEKNPGAKVGVIGGGNVAIDVARSLLRLGSKPVIIYRRTKAEMPALKDEIEKGVQEGITFEFLTSLAKATKKNGHIVLNCIRMELGPVDETGRHRPIPVKGSEFALEFNTVIKATGEESDNSIVPDEFLDNKGKLKINAGTFYLGENLFSGGDFVTGPATVVAAVAAGRQAADSINRYLQPRCNPEKYQQHSNASSPQRFDSSCLLKTNRAKVPEIALMERLKSLNIEETETLSLEAIQVEANRCFNCGCVAVNSSDLAPALVALNANVKTTQRVIKAEDFFTAGIDKTTILNDAEIVEAIEIPLSGLSTRTKFIKFALRKSIDFPIVNCSAAINYENGVVKSARICLNAVYNLPFRAKGVEEYIIGKSINENNAEEASNAVIKEALPLLNNKYKIQIAKTLVKRAILACQPETK